MSDDEKTVLIKNLKTKYDEVHRNYQTQTHLMTLDNPNKKKRFPLISLIDYFKEEKLGKTDGPNLKSNPKANVADNIN